MRRLVVFDDRNESLLEIDLPGAGDPKTFSVEETKRIGFAVENPEAEDELHISIGEQALADDLRHQLRREIQWETSACFDGANGVTPIVLHQGSDGRTLARAYALVEPNKLSLQAYEHMFEEITRISIELLLDLATKSRLKLATSANVPARTNAMAVSARLELSRIRQFWQGFSGVLSQILESPVINMESETLVRRRRPGERVENKTLRRLAASGVSVKRMKQVGLVLALPTMTATTDTLENRVIAGFIDLLRTRLLRSRDVATREHQAVKSKMNRYAESEPDLHNFIQRRETPRISKLEKTIEMIDRLVVEISRTKQYFDNSNNRRQARSSLEDLDTPVFRNHPIYARAALSIRAFLTQTAMVVEQGGDEGAKGIETLYEQWVFFETCAALRAAGLSCVSHKSVFEPISRNRFLVDVDRNATVVFETQNGRRVSVRYEPTILPRGSAQGIDTLYRGNARTPWTPDIVLEVMEPRDGPLDYAVVIDAKYTKFYNLERKLNEISRYQEIRSVVTDKQIVRQVWVAAPVEAVIMPRDETILWSSDGEIGADPADVIMGSVGVDPSTPVETAATMKSLILGILSHSREFITFGASEEL
jgi:hypothetical protein